MDDKDKNKKEKNDPKAKKGRSLTGKPLDKIDTTPTLDAVSTQLPFESVGKTVVLTQTTLNETELLESLRSVVAEADNIVVITHESIKDDVKKILRTANEEIRCESLCVMAVTDLSEGSTEGFEIFEGITLNEAILSVQQRIKRKNLMKRLKAKIKRGRRIAKKKFASKEKLVVRASKQARQLLRKRFAGQQGADYRNLSLAARIAVDKRLDKKAALVKKIAKRLLPKVRKKEMDRLSRARKTAKNESVNVDNKELFDIVERFLDNIHSMELNENVLSNLEKKSSQNSIHIDILKEVFIRGLESYVAEETKLTKEQWAFNRVNSFISGGAAAKEDSDLYEKRSMLSQLMPKVDAKLDLIRYKKQYQAAMDVFMKRVSEKPELLKKGNTLGKVAQEFQNVSARELYKLLKKNHPNVFNPVAAEEMTYEEYMRKTNTLFLTVENTKNNFIKEKAGKVLESLRSKEDDMKSFKQFSESKDSYDIYHKDFSSAVQHAMKQAKARGFEIDDDEWFSKVSSGPKKPGTGKTNSYNIELMKKGMTAKQKLHMQVYNKGGGNQPFELNMYIQ